MESIRNFFAKTVGGSYYSLYTWDHNKSETEEDVELNKKKCSEEDRVLDLLLIMDCTASMSSWIELSKRTLVDVMHEVQGENKDMQIRVAFVGYRDFCDPSTIFAIHDFTLDTQKIATYISGQSASGGGDAPEDVQGALKQGLDLKWRENSIKMCYFCADAAAHGKTYHPVGLADDHPNGNPAGYMLEELMKEYAKREVDFTVYILTNETEIMFDIMEASYKAGLSRELRAEMEAKETPTGDGQAKMSLEKFKRIDLRGEIKKVNDAGGSLVAAGGVMEAAYKEETGGHMKSRANYHRMKKGW